MADNDNWAEKLKARICDSIDQLYRFFGVWDEGVYIETGANRGKIDIDVRFSIKVRKK